MSWYLDNIDLKTYGVGVRRVAGLLDMPRLAIEPHDWPDADGPDYWQADSEARYRERDIVLHCWIAARADDDFTGYENFCAAVANFYDAITAPGLRALKYNATAIADVFVQRPVEIARKSSYLSALQVGFFSLTLTVPGDDESLPITIYDTLGGVRGVYNFRKDAKLSQRLMGDDQVTFDLEATTNNALGRDDYIMLGSEKYISFEYPERKKYGSNKFIFRLTFQHEFFKLKDIQFRLNGYAETYLHTTMQGIVDAVVANAGRQFPGLFAAGTVESTIFKNHQFSNESCFDVLTRIAEDYELEWNYHVAEGVIYINVVEKVGVETSLSLGYGKGNGMYTINRISTTRDKMMTHLYAYGAEKNLPSTYGCNRLQPATQPLVKPFYSVIREATKVWDDIFPERTGTVSGYTYTPSDDPDVYPEREKFEVEDSLMPFDLNESDEFGTVYLIPGTSPKIHFNSGDLAGFEFEIEKYNHATKTFSLIPLTEVNDVRYPNATLYPQAGDEYVLIDINLPQSYIDDAETRLAARAQEYLDYWYSPKTTFSVETEPGFAATLRAGDRVQVTDADFVNELLRVTEITRNLYTGAGTIFLSDMVRISNRQLLEKRVKQVETVVEKVAISDVADQRRSTVSVKEVENKIIDPKDEKLRADLLVRSESIDPRMLAYDAGVPQFFLKGALVECNVDGDEDKISVTAGTISITNWRPYTMQRAAIDNLRSNDEVYDPTRTWNIAATTIELPTKDGYFIYAKLDMTAESTACTIVALPTHQEVKVDYVNETATGYLWYKLGNISAGEEDAI
jgi:hypothetical protein